MEKSKLKTARASLKGKIAFTVTGVNLKKLDLKCPQHHTNLWLTQRKDEFGATIVTIFCMKCKKRAPRAPSIATINDDGSIKICMDNTKLSKVYNVHMTRFLTKGGERFESGEIR